MSRFSRVLYLNMHTTFDTETLTAEQRDVIRAAANHQGKVFIQRASRTGGRAVCYGIKDAFFDRRDREVAQRYIASLQELVQLQVLRPAGAHEHFELTNSGWEISRKLS